MLASVLIKCYQTTAILVSLNQFFVFRYHNHEKVISRRTHTPSSSSTPQSTYCAKVLSCSGVSLIWTIHSSCWKRFSLLERLFSSMPLMWRPSDLVRHTVQSEYESMEVNTYMITCQHLNFLMHIYESTLPSAFSVRMSNWLQVDVAERVCIYSMCASVCVCAYRPLREEQ